MAEFVKECGMLYDPDCASILVNFGINKHGCDQQCPFCVWRLVPWGKQRSVPSNQDLEDFLKYANKRMITLSGGGEPLWNFEENKNEVFRIVNYLHGRNRKVELVTRDYNRVLKYCDNELSIMDGFSFSVGGINPIVEKISNKIGANKIRVSIVYNNEPVEKIKEMIEFYQPLVRNFQIKSNYITPMSKENLSFFRNLGKKYSNSNFQVFVMDVNDYELILYGSKIFTTKYEDDVLRKQVEELNNNTGR